MKYFETVEDLKKAVHNCQRCQLCKTRTHTVFGEGDLAARLMFVGEGPGAREDETGRPFVGPAGQLLDKMIAAMGYARSQVYIANVVKCRPPGNADPQPEYAQKCLPYLREQVRAIRPKVIVCLGRIATQYLTGESRLANCHGQVFRRKGLLIVPTYHPSALLRNPNLKRAAWEDLKIVRQLLEEEGN